MEPIAQQFMLDITDWTELVVYIFAGVNYIYLRPLYTMAYTVMDEAYWNDYNHLISLPMYSIHKVGYQAGSFKEINYLRLEIKMSDYAQL